MNFKHLALAAALALPAVAVVAQTPSATQTPATTPTNQSINQREENQQDRIGQGVTSGQLTPAETSHLEHQEAAINHEEKAMRAQDNGHLTKQDRKTLNQQQNQESKRIYKDKHNNRKSGS